MYISSGELGDSTMEFGTVDRSGEKIPQSTKGILVSESSQAAQEIFVIRS